MARRSIKEQLAEAGIEDRSDEVTKIFRDAVNKVKKSKDYELPEDWREKSTKIINSAVTVFRDVLNEFRGGITDEDEFYKQVVKLTKLVIKEMNNASV